MLRKPLDAVALAVSFLTVVTVSIAAINRDSPGWVEITSDSGVFVYPIDVDRAIVVDGPLGTTTVEIRDHKVRVAEDPGPRQICVRQGWIERSGAWLACLPSRMSTVFVVGLPVGAAPI